MADNYGVLAMSAPPSDYGKAVAEVYRDLRREFENKTNVTVPDEKGGAQSKPIDPSVREEINSDFKRLIEKNEKRGSNG
jgi:hypothetical protein